jgi:hypothetical protein
LPVPLVCRPNNRRRRNQRFHVEALEARALLSTAGVASRPGAVVAPLGQVVQISNIGAYPKFEGEMSGKFQVTADGRFMFETSGALHGKYNGKEVFGRDTKFDASPEFYDILGDSDKYGIALYAGLGRIGKKQNGLTVGVDVLAFRNQGENTHVVIILGALLARDGDLKGTEEGNYEGIGYINRRSGTIDFHLTVNGKGSPKLF